jgi:Ca2+-transporting ATPase
MLVPFSSAPIETVLAARPDGLTEIGADRQRLRFGPNRSSDTRKTTPLGLLPNQFRSALVILLLFAMALCLFLGETTDWMISRQLLFLCGPGHFHDSSVRRIDCATRWNERWYA